MPRSTRRSGRLLALLALGPGAALAVGYDPVDLLAAARRHMAPAMLKDMAEQTRDSTAVEKACLVASGMPAGLVARVRGPEPAPWSAGLEAECKRLGLAVIAGSAAQPDAAAFTAPAAPVAAPPPPRAPTVRATGSPACFVPLALEGLQLPDAKQRQLEAWMAEQLAAGRDEFVGTAWGDLPVLCAW